METSVGRVLRERGRLIADQDSIPSTTRLKQAEPLSYSAVFQEAETLLEGEPMMSTASRDSSVTVLREINLGAHHLFIMSDQSIDLLVGEQAPSGAEYALSLDSCEAYRLLISLQEVFTQGTDQSRVPEGILGTSWDPSQGDRR